MRKKNLLSGLANPALLSLVGLALLTVAAFLWLIPVGFVAAGLSCIIMEWRITS